MGWKWLLSPGSLFWILRERERARAMVKTVLQKRDRERAGAIVKDCLAIERERGGAMVKTTLQKRERERESRGCGEDCLAIHSYKCPIDSSTVQG